MSGQFVGRGAELDLFAQLFRRSAGHSPAAALMTGPPGSGKSRLLSEVVERFKPARAVRLVGFEPIQAVPLAASAELLRQLARMPAHGPELAALAFGEGRGDRDTLRIYETAQRTVAAAGPVLICVDDVQWLDDASLGLVHYLLRAASASRLPVLVVGAGRPSRLADSFRASIEATLPVDARLLIELGPLPLEDGVRLVRALDNAIDDPSAAELWRRAQGSPFWLEALARRVSDDPRMPIIEERLGALGGDASRLLAAIVVASRPFTVEQLRRVLAWPEEKLRQAAAELVSRGLAAETAGSLATAHDLIRETAMDGLPRASRRRFHAAFAQLLAADAGDDLQLLCEALEHRQSAGLPGADLALRIVSSRRRRLLGGDALKLLGTIADELPPGSRERRRLNAGVAELARATGNQQLALERWRLVARETGADTGRQRAELGAARAAYRLGRSADALAHLRSARATAPVDAEAEVEINALEALVALWLEHQTTRGSKLAARALRAARTMLASVGGLQSLPFSAGQAYLAALQAASDAALQRDRHAELTQLQMEIVTAARELGNEENYLRSLVESGRYSFWQGSVIDAEERFREAWETSRRLVLPVEMLNAGRWLARALHTLGRLREAREVISETVELEARVTAEAAWGPSIKILHALELSLGEPAIALAALRGDAQAEPDPHYRIGIWQTLAEWQARSHGGQRRAEVEGALAAAAAESQAVGCPRCARELSIVGAELLARIGQIEEAEERYAAWQAEVRFEEPIQRLWGARAHAALAAAHDEIEDAVAALEGVIEHARKLSRVEDILWAYLDLGRLLAPVDAGRAVSALEEAASLAEQIGAISQSRMAAQLLRRLGRRTWRRKGSAPDGSKERLTEREAEIAGLVAAGASNREIGESLLISPKTVERHVTNALAKLGLRNRTELAARLISSRHVRDSPDDRRAPGT